MFLHPTRYFQNYAAFWPKVIEAAVLAEPWSDATRFSLVDYSDVAEAAAIALTEDRLLYGTFELCAPGHPNRYEIAGLMSDVLGRTIGERRDPGVLGDVSPPMQAMFEHYDHHPPSARKPANAARHSSPTTAVVAGLLRRVGGERENMTMDAPPMDQIAAWLDRNNVNVLVLIATIFLLVATPLATLGLNRLVRKLVRRGERRLHLPYETVLTVTRMVTGGLWLISTTLILSLWGISVSGLWTLLISAIAVIGVGFLAVWTIISNVTASFFITVWRPFNLGHTVEILPENLKGRVIDRNMMFTVLREEGGNILQIPNNLFFQKMFRVADGSREWFFESLEKEDLVTTELDRR